MKDTFSLTVRRQFNAFVFALILIGVIIGLEIYLRKEVFNYAKWELTAWLFAVLIIPVLFLHLEYYFKNKDAVLKIDYKNLFFEFFKNRKTIKLNFSDIAQIIVYMAPSLHRKSSMQFLPIEPYHFAIIYSKEGDKIVITSLMMENIDDELSKIKGVKIVRKKRLFASIWLGN